MVFTLLLRREGEERSSPKRGRKLTSDLDFTNICWRKNISVFTVLFYFKVMFGFRLPVEVPGSRRVGNGLTFCSRNQGMCTRERRVNLHLNLTFTHEEPGSILWLRSHDLVAYFHNALCLRGERLSLMR